MYMEYPHLNTGLYGLYMDYQPLLSGMRNVGKS